MSWVSIIAFVVKHLPKIIGILIVLALLAGVYAKGNSDGRNHVQAEWDKKKLEAIQAQQEADRVAAEKLRKLEEEKNENISYVSDLYFRLGKLERVRVPRPKTLPVVPTGCEAEVAGERHFFEFVRVRTEEAIGRFDEGYRAAAYSADKIVEECRVLNTE